MKLPWQSDSERNLDKSIDDLRSEIAQWETKLAKLQQTREAALTSESALRREREQHVINAFADDDENARSQLLRLDSASDRAASEASDLTIAVQQAERKLGTLREMLAKTERRLQITTAKADVARRLAMSGPIQEQITKLISMLVEADEVVGRIDEILLRFDIRDLRRTVQLRTREYSVKYIRMQLNAPFPQGALEFRTDLLQGTFADLDKRCFDLVLLELERAERNCEGSEAELVTTANGR